MKILKVQTFNTDEIILLVCPALQSLCHRDMDPNWLVHNQTQHQMSSRNTQEWSIHGRMEGRFCENLRWEEFWRRDNGGWRIVEEPPKVLFKWKAQWSKMHPHSRRQKMNTKGFPHRSERHHGPIAVHKEHKSWPPKEEVHVDETASQNRGIHTATVLWPFATPSLIRLRQWTESNETSLTPKKWILLPGIEEPSIFLDDCVSSTKLLTIPGWGSGWIFLWELLGRQTSVLHQPHSHNAPHTNVPSTK